MAGHRVVTEAHRADARPAAEAGASAGGGAGRADSVAGDLAAEAVADSEARAGLAAAIPGVGRALAAAHPGVPRASRDSEKEVPRMARDPRAAGVGSRVASIPAGRASPARDRAGHDQAARGRSTLARAASAPVDSDLTARVPSPGLRGPRPGCATTRRMTLADRSPADRGSTGRRDRQVVAGRRAGADPSTRRRPCVPERPRRHSTRAKSSLPAAARSRRRSRRAGLRAGCSSRRSVARRSRRSCSTPPPFASRSWRSRAAR